MTSDVLREALDEAMALVAGAGNGTWTRQRPIEEWQRLWRLFDEARAALEAAPASPGPLDALAEVLAVYDPLPKTSDWSAAAIEIIRLPAESYHGNGWQAWVRGTVAPSTFGTGDTPAEALLALAKALREDRKP